MHNLRVCLGVLILAALASCSKQESDDAGINGSGTGSTGSGSTGSGSTGNASGTLGGDANVGGNGSGTGSTGTGSTGTGSTGTGSTGTGSTTGSDVGGTGNGGAGGTGSGTGGSTEVVACTTVSGETRSEAAPPVIEFALDNTNSMSDVTPSTNGDTKWVALQKAFTSAIPTLAASHPEYAVGLTYFHYRGYGPPGNPCTDALQAVEIAPLSTAQSTAIVNNVNNENQIQMTPTQDIWQFAADHVLAWQGDSIYDSSNRYAVVLTDGVPTVAGGCATAAPCNGAQGISVAQYAPFITVVRDYKQNRKLTTFMIAVPGAESLSQVTCSDGSLMYTPITKTGEVATAGGTELIDLTTSATTDFTAALIDAITKEIGEGVSTVVGCEYPVPEPPLDVDGNVQFVDPTKVEVMYYQNGGASCSSDADCGGAKCSITASNPNKCYSTIPRSDGCSDPNGWEYTDSNNKTIRLCSGVCSIAQADTGAKIEVIIGCFRVG